MVTRSVSALILISRGAGGSSSFGDEDEFGLLTRLLNSKRLCLVILITSSRALSLKCPSGVKGLFARVEWSEAQHNTQHKSSLHTRTSQLNCFLFPSFHPRLWLGSEIVGTDQWFFR